MLTGTICTVYCSRPVRQTRRVVKYEAKNDDDAIFKGAMMAKEKGFF
jgi:hypothetical protein